MAGPNVGYAAVSVIPSARGFGAALSGQIAGPVGQVGDQAGKQMGGRMSAALGTVLKVGMGGALAGLGAVAGLAKLGSSFDDAFDTIRVGTGATGEALDGLSQSFKNVFGSLPTDMGSASTAIADLNTRLGLTGEQLETSASQFLELSRITGTDLSGNITAVTRAFGDWSVSAERQEKSLDSLFRAAQASGATVEQLANGLVQFGSPLRQFGFSMGKTTALLAGFEQAGVNTELVMGSMRIALGKFSKDGRDPAKALEWTIDAIKNAGSAAEANTLAFEIFGARAGADMAAAIREGRFELGAIYDAIGEGSETIMGAAEDTNDWKESWERLRNQGFVLLEPVATRVFEALAVGMDWIAERAPVFVAWFQEHIFPAVEKVAGVIGGIASDGLAAISDWWSDNGDTVLGGLSTAFDTIAGVIEDPLLPALESLATFVKDEVLARLKELFNYITTNEYVLKIVLVGAIGLVTKAFVGWAAAAGAAAVATLLAMGAAILANLPLIVLGLLIAAVAAGFWWAYENVGWFRRGVDDVVDGLGEFIDMMKDAYDWLDRLIRRIGDYLDSVSGLGVSAGGGLGLDDLARAGLAGVGIRFNGFDTGGIVPGYRGEPQLALVHGGETILPTHKQDYTLPVISGERRKVVEAHFYGVERQTADSILGRLALEMAGT